MSGDPPAEPRPIEPDRLGPLDESGGGASGPGTLFPGDARWFGAGEVRRRRAIWQALAPRIEAVCAPGERVIYVARGYRYLTVGMYLGLGWLAQRYHQVTLVVTDRRLIEVLHGLDGARLETCTRSFPWSAVRSVGTGVRGFAVEGPDGKRTRWTLRTSGDRRILKILAPRIEQRLLGAGQPPASFPVEHCPGCVADHADAERPCPACSGLARSARLATFLSLAFPGAGLAYVGHPVLAFFDFLGEVLIVGFVAMGLAVARGADEIAGIASLGVVLGLLTKLESIHVSRLLAARRRPETQDRRDRFRTLGRVGAVLSVVTLAGAALGTGRMVERIDHDLDFTAAAGWSGSRAPSGWQIFPADPDVRSEWTHEDGLTVAVFAFTNRAEPVAFARDFLRGEQAHGGTIVDQGFDLPGGFDGFHVVEQITPESADPVALVTIFVFDLDGHDVHQIYSVVDVPSAPDAAALLQALLESGRWIDAVQPEG